MAKSILDFWKNAAALITDTSGLLDTRALLDTKKISDTSDVLNTDKIFNDENDEAENEETNLNLTVEEVKAWKLKKSIDKTKILITSFQNKIIIAKSKSDASNIVIESAQELFTTAVNMINEDWNWRDNYLYWTRLIFRCILKKSKNKVVKSSIEELIILVEEYSRGRATVELDPNIKNILISGFELFDVSQGNELTQANQSGILALSLHNKVITLADGEAKIQSVIWSNRYEDFNNNLIENFYAEYFNKVDLIITFSLDANDNTTINIERFAANYRGGFKDNNNIGVKENKTVKSDNPFYESTLPYIPMVKKNLSFKVFNTFLREGYSGISKEGKELGDYYLDVHNTNPESLIIDLTNLELDIMKTGGGGNYFSNEIFFRVASLRDKINPNFPYGHIHVPNVQKVDYEDYISLITKIIKDAF